MGLLGRLREYRAYHLQRETEVNPELFDLVSRHVAQDASAALEGAARLIGAALGGARVEGRIASRVLPAHLETIGRRLIRNGELALYFSVEPPGVPRFREPTSWSLQGGALAPETWVYELDFAGITSAHTLTARAEEVAHLRYATRAEAPWRGIPPCGWAENTRRMVDGIERQLGDEASGPSGYIIGQPYDHRNVAGQSSLAEYSAKLTRLQGSTAYEKASVSSTQQTDDVGTIVATAIRNFGPNRVGANPPTALIALRESVAQSIYTLCGIPLDLLGVANGPSRTAAFRGFVELTLEPLARLIERECSRVLEEDVSLTFDSASKADIGVRARSFKSLVESGMTLAKAAALTGLLLESD